MREVREETFRTFDGTELFYRQWPVNVGPSSGAIVLFHRGHEHSGRVAHLVDELGMGDFEFYAWDARGHGRSPGPRGSSPSIGTRVTDSPLATPKQTPGRARVVAGSSGQEGSAAAAGSS